MTRLGANETVLLLLIVALWQGNLRLESGVVAGEVYYGNQFPVCPFCSDDFCALLRRECGPLNDGNLANCKAMVETYCSSVGLGGDPGCECCQWVDNSTTSCFVEGSRCNTTGVNFWACAPGLHSNISCSAVPDACDATWYESYNYRTLHEVPASKLLNGWTIRHGTDPLRGYTGDKNMPPSFWRDDYFAHVRGTVNVGTERGIFVLPVGFRPSRDTSFVCNSAADDIHNATLPILVTVTSDGMVAVNSLDVVLAITSLELKADFTWGDDDGHRVWNSLSGHVATGVVVSSEPSFYIDDQTGWVHIRGHLTLSSACAQKECLLLSGLQAAGITPCSLAQRQYFVQLDDGNGQGRYVVFSEEGDVFVNGGPSSSAREVYLDNIVLLEEGAECSHPDGGSTPFRPSEIWPLMNRTQHQLLRTGVSQLGGVAIPSNFSFYGSIIGAVVHAARPEFRLKQLVPCRVSPYMLTCSVVVDHEGSVFVFSPLENPPYSFAPTNADNFVALDNVRWGGFVYNAGLRIGGASDVNIVGQSFIGSEPGAPSSASRLEDSSSSKGNCTAGNPAHPTCAGTFIPRDRAELKAAVDLCLADAPDGNCATVASTRVPTGQGTGVYGAIGTWNISLVTDLHDMFAASTSPSSLFSQSISTWDTARVTSMSGTFQGQVSYTDDLSSWSTSRVKTLSKMFKDCSAFQGDVSTFDLSSATDISEIFSGSSSFNGDVTAWQTATVVDASRSFLGAAAFDRDIRAWDVSNVVDASAMFWGAEAFDQDLAAWDVSKVNRMDKMFHDATAFSHDITAWDTSSLPIAITDMFGGSYSGTCASHGSGANIIICDRYTLLASGSIDVDPTPGPGS